MSPCRHFVTFFSAAAYALVSVLLAGGHSHRHDHAGHHDAVACVDDHSKTHHHEHDAHHGHDAHHHHDADATSPQSDQPACPGEKHDDCAVCQHLASPVLPAMVETPPTLGELRHCLAEVLPSQTPVPPPAAHPARGPPRSV